MALRDGVHQLVRWFCGPRWRRWPRDATIREMAPENSGTIDGLVLAGGKSTRFGTDKASALLRGRPLLQWVVSALEPACGRIVVVRARGQVLPTVESRAEIVVVEDLYEAKGPLAGLVTGFPAVRASLCFATSCDAPLLRTALVTLLANLADGFDVVCPDVGGFQQPLAAVYRVAACLPIFERNVQEDRLRIVPAFAELRTRMAGEDEIRPADPEFDSFRNANRPERLAEIEELLRARESLR